MSKNKTSAQRLETAKRLYQYHKQSSDKPWYLRNRLIREMRSLAREVEINSNPYSDDSQAVMYLDAVALRLGIDLEYKKQEV